jgi:DNA-binding transcriptional MerR regulator
VHAHPLRRNAGGRGTKRVYSFHDLICLKLVKDLTRYGFSLQKIRRCLKPLRHYVAATTEPADSLRYLTDGDKLFMITSDREKILHAMERQFVLSLGIGNLVRELNGAVARAAIPERRRALAVAGLETKPSGQA